MGEYPAVDWGPLLRDTSQAVTPLGNQHAASHPTQVPVSMSVQNWTARHRALSVLLPLLMIGVLSLVILKRVAGAYWPLDWLLAGWCVWTGFVYRRWQRWGINLAAILFVLGGAEALLPPTQTGITKYTSLDHRGLQYTVIDDRLGSSPRPGSRTRYQLVDRGKTLIDTIYTIDEHGLRVIPDTAPPENAPTAAFFGCSLTYGDGVLDNETLPAQVAQRRPDLQFVNFGFSGYGPHQMLANLESGRVEELCPNPPRRMIFQMIPDHVQIGRAHV